MQARRPTGREVAGGASRATRLEDYRRVAGVGEVLGAGEAGEAAADDGHLPGWAAEVGGRDMWPGWVAEMGGRDGWPG